MSLLTEEQIEEVVHIFLNNRDTNAVAIKTAMEKWNEKQPSTQFEPDWSAAPDSVVSAVAHLAWIDEDGYMLPGYEIATFERPTPIITPHPHAAIMAKYAEVAARRVDPWVEFERFSHCDREWDGLPYHPDWTQGQEYRYIGDDK
jgi:hypothetical protein